VLLPHGPAFERSAAKRDAYHELEAAVDSGNAERIAVAMTRGVGALKEQEVPR
jgi:hypothetical protein